MSLSHFLKRCSLSVSTYDKTREEKFANLNEWYKEIKIHAASDDQIHPVDNKSDFVSQYEMTFEKASEFAKGIKNKIHKFLKLQPRQALQWRKY